MRVRTIALCLGLGVAAGCSGTVDGENPEGSADSEGSKTNGTGTNPRPGTPGTMTGGPMAPGTVGPAGPVGPSGVGGMGGGNMVIAMPPPKNQVPSEGGLRPLTRIEMANTLADLLGDGSLVLQRLAEETQDKEFAFDNNRHANAKLGLNMVRAMELLFKDMIDATLADPKKRTAIVPCTPTGAADADCMKKFVADFGLRALRRPLLPAEATLYEGFIDAGKDANDFYVAVSGAARAILMNPEFIYRAELGDPVVGNPELLKLTGYEMATRLSYTLVGSTPDRTLLDDARTGKLETPEGRRTAATRLFATPAAKARMNHFHAYWLGFQQVLSAGKADPFFEETSTLISDVVFDNKRDYRDLFLSKKTFLNAALRKHYDDIGAPAGGNGWVNYPAADPARPGGERAGILSHGTFLSAKKDGDETSIPRRGALIAARLLCSPVPDPPPNVNVDLSGLASKCTTGPEGFYATTHSAPTCAGCHALLDPVGIGIERFNAAGKYRSTDSKKPQCKIDTTGSRLTLPSGPTPFDGPASLAKVLVNSGVLEGCVARHAYRFYTGLHEEAADEPAINDLTEKFKNSNRDFASLWVEMAASSTFPFARPSH